MVYRTIKVAVVGIVIMITGSMTLALYLKGNTMAKQQPQTMPAPTIWHKMLQGALRTPKDIQASFLNDVHTFASENQYIPKKDSHQLRLVNFNVRMWTTIYDEPNFDTAHALLKTVDPDILLLQEVVDWEKTYNQYVSLGYDSVAAHCDTQNPPFCPVIFAKRCTVVHTQNVIFKAQMNEKRQLCFVRMDLLCGSKEMPITIYNTHLEVDQKQLSASMEKVRFEQLQEILEDAKTVSHGNIIIAGDFNSVQEKDYAFMAEGHSSWDLLKQAYAQYNLALEPKVLNLVDQEQFKDSFAFLGWQGPKFTNWAGRVLDFVYLSKEMSLKPVASYIYYTDISDHLPIIVDLQMPE